MDHELNAIELEELRLDHERAELTRLLRDLPADIVEAEIAAWREDRNVLVHFHVEDPNDLPF